MKDVLLLLFSHKVMSDFCKPRVCSPPGSSVHGIHQVRILEWIAISFSRGPSQPRDQTQVSWIADGFFTDWATREVCIGRQILNPRTTRKGPRVTTLDYAVVFPFPKSGSWKKLNKTQRLLLFLSQNGLMLITNLYQSSTLQKLDENVLLWQVLWWSIFQRT